MVTDIIKKEMLEIKAKYADPRRTEISPLEDEINFEELIAESITLMNQLTALKKGELKRIQGQSGSTKVSMVYLNMVQEAQNVVSFTANLLKVSRKFQKE